MQINRNMSAVIANNQLLGIEGKLSASIERLSSGLKINRASDNPAGMAISNKMKAQIDALDQAEANAADGISVVQIADGALSEVSSILQRMRELSVQAATGTNSYNDRVSMQDEIAELRKEVDRISSDTEYNTKKLLDGSSDVRIYGENGSRFQVSDAVEAQIYSVNVESMGAQATVVLDYEVPQESGLITINGVSAEVTAGIDKESYLESIRNAAAEAGCSVKISDDNTKLEIVSDYYGYDETISCTITSKLAETLGVGANADSTYVINESTFRFPAEDIPQDGCIIIHDKKINVTQGMTADEYFEKIQIAAKELGFDASIDQATGELVVKADIGKTEFSFSNAIADAWNVTADYNGEYQIDTTGKDAVVKIPENVKAAGFTGTTSVECDGNRVLITDNNGFSIDFLLNENYQPVADAENGNFEIEVTDIGTLTIQIGANEYQTMDVKISEISAETLYLDQVDVAVAKGADRAMNILDEAIASVSATRSRIGAFQNRLEYAQTSLASSVENITEAYSALIDTDMAEEMTEYTQQNILNQAAISVLSQANELPQQILSMLQ